MDEKEKVPVHQYALDGTAKPSPLTFEYSQLRTKVYEIVDGKNIRWNDVQGISFQAKGIRLVGGSGKGDLVSANYEFDGVAGSIICIPSAYHRALTPTSELHVEVMPEKESDVGQRIHLVLYGFKSISVGMGLSIDDLVVEMNYAMSSGKGSMTITSKQPDVQEDKESS